MQEDLKKFADTLELKEDLLSAQKKVAVTGKSDDLAIKELQQVS